MIARNLYIAGMVVIPMSAVTGINGLGEMQHELSTYFFIPAIWFALIAALPGVDFVGGSHRFSLPTAYLLPKILFGFFAIIAASFLFNSYTISTDYFRGRYGLTKFIFSLVVLVYGFSLAYATYFLARERWQNLILVPIAVSVLFCAVYSIFEVLAWYGIMKGVYEQLYQLTHGGFSSLFVAWNGTLKRNIDWETRLRSLAFEPPAFGNYAGFAWPWILAGIGISRGLAKAFYVVCFVLLNILLVLADARTGYVMLVVNVMVWIGLLFIYLPKNPAPNYQRISHTVNFLVWCGAASVFALIVASYDTMIYNVIADDNISNISRLASQTSAFNMFMANPLIGVGFGQFGFHTSQYLPYWGYYSWELQPWLIFPEAPWPAVYSIYARLAAETGLIGTIAWVGLWVVLAKRITVASRACQRLTGILPPASYPLIMSCFCNLSTGVASDSFRTPMIWIVMGLCCRYLEETRQLLARTATPAQNLAVSGAQRPSGSISCPQSVV